MSGCFFLKRCRTRTLRTWSELEPESNWSILTNPRVGTASLTETQRWRTFLISTFNLENLTNDTSINILQRLKIISNNIQFFISCFCFNINPNLTAKVAGFALPPKLCWRQSFAAAALVHLMHVLVIRWSHIDCGCNVGLVTFCSFTFIFSYLLT